MALQLRPHGKCTYSIQNNIVIIEAEGPWNLEFFVEMHKDLRQIIIENLDINDYKILVVFKGNALSVQDGLDYHLNNVKLGKAKAIACSLEFSNNPSFTQMLFEKVYDEALLENRFFTTTTEALQWLEKTGEDT